MNVPWPGGAKADPAGLGFRFEERAAAAGVADPFAGMGIAVDGAGGGPLNLFVTNSRGEPSAAFAGRAAPRSRTRGPPSTRRSDGLRRLGRVVGRPRRTRARPDLVLATGAIPVTNLRRTPARCRCSLRSPARRCAVRRRAGRRAGCAERARARRRRRRQRRPRWRSRSTRSAASSCCCGPPAGRPLARREALALRAGRGRDGELADGRALAEVRAGSSYLSSEDPRVHFGLGERDASRASDRALSVGRRERAAQRSRRPDRRGQGASPSRLPSTPARGRTPRGLTPPRRPLDRDGLGQETRSPCSASGGASEPVQARDLYDVSAAMWQAWKAMRRRDARPPATRRSATPRTGCCSGVRRSTRTCDDVRSADEAKLRALCYSPDFTADARRVAGGAGQPDRRRRDRRRPARRLERVAALRRPDLHARATRR